MKKNLISKCVCGDNPQHKKTKDDFNEDTFYCPICKKEDYCLYINKKRMLKVKINNENGISYDSFFECLRPFVKNMQKKRNL